MLDGNQGGHVVNAHEAAILGIHRVQLRPQPTGDGLGIEWRKYALSLITITVNGTHVV